MKLILRSMVGCAAGAILALVAWHGVMRWMPWWAQSLVGIGIVVGWLVWACCIVAGRADDSDDRAWREHIIHVLGQDVPAVWK